MFATVRLFCWFLVVSIAGALFACGKSKIIATGSAISREQKDNNRPLSPEPTVVPPVIVTGSFLSGVMVDAAGVVVSDTSLQIENGGQQIGEWGRSLGIEVPESSDAAWNSSKRIAVAAFSLPNLSSQEKFFSENKFVFAVESPLPASASQLILGPEVCGQIDELRISHFIRYTTDFTPPAAAMTAD